VQMSERVLVKDTLKKGKKPRRKGKRRRKK
jgi:ribosomal protein S6E (S10)